MKKYKIVNKKRFYSFLTALFILLISITNILKPSSKVYSNILETSFIEVKVSKGDTLWDIASHYMPEEYNIRKMIYNIKTTNQMKTSYIFPGEIIQIPIIR
jgi:LysM repeat protein